MRDQHIQFIKNDTQQRGETITGDINSLRAIYMLEVLKPNTRKRMVTYSAAENKMKGFRKIKSK